MKTIAILICILMIIGTIASITYAIISSIRNKNNKTINTENDIFNTTYNNNQNNQEIYPYHQKYLLTKNEYYFYKRMTDITNPLNLQILAKIKISRFNRSQFRTKSIRTRNLLQQDKI